MLQWHKSSDVSKSFSRHACDDSVHAHGGTVSPNMSTFDILKLFFPPEEEDLTVMNPWLNNFIFLMSSLFFLSKLSQEEVERRRVRRERNKLAAAKCRNRRRELTETLQSVSERSTNVTPVTL